SGSGKTQLRSWNHRRQLRGGKSQPRGSRQPARLRSTFAWAMNSLFWERAHGGLTHFPIALIFVATFFDIISLVRDRSAKGRDFNTIGYWLLILAALGAVAAVFSGLGLSKWEIMGTGLMQLHHLFVWPAFGLILALTAWRVAARNEFSRRAFASYLIAACCACALIGAAGFVGGEMLLGETNSNASSAIM